MFPRSIPLLRVLAVLAAIPLLLACDKGGIYPLLEARDPAAGVACDASAPSSTWLRSTALGTEFLVVATTTPASGTDGGTVCFGRGLVEHDSSSTYDYGGLTLDADGEGELAIATTFEFEYVPTGAILDRRGSHRENFSPPRQVAVAMLLVDGALEVTLDGAKGRYTHLDDVARAIDLSTQEGAEDAFRLVNLPLFASQVRLLGFGGGGMTQYISAPGTFVGLARADGPETPNFFQVRVESFTSPNTDIDYHTFEDFSGLVLDGLQETNVSISGSGRMRGVLDWSIEPTGGGADGVTLRGTIGYDAIEIGNGVASGGTYEFTVSEPVQASFTLPYTLASDTDLRGLIPEDSN